MGCKPQSQGLKEDCLWPELWRCVCGNGNLTCLWLGFFFFFFSQQSFLLDPHHDSQLLIDPIKSEFLTSHGSQTPSCEQGQRKVLG